ncbi:hypothetical protein B0H13DRAFT_2112178, partial [Mycena leptocephala]
MHFTRSIIAFAVAAVTLVQASLVPVVAREGCGLLPQCQCEVNPATGCELLFDECSQQFYWPSTCGACGACPKVCVICKWSSLSAVRADDGL